MPRPSIAALAVLVVLAGFAAPLSAAVDAEWAEVASVRDRDCMLSVTGNGRFFRIAASGLAPGGEVRFVLANGDMRPLDWRVRADAAGDFARYYLPFRWHRSGGEVKVSLVGAGCELDTGFTWRRRGMPVAG